MECLLQTGDTDSDLKKDAIKDTLTLNYWKQIALKTSTRVFL